MKQFCLDKNYNIILMLQLEFKLRVPFFLKNKN